MALDDKEKAFSVIGVGRPWMRTKLPVATPDEEWRASSGNSYGGNALSPSVAVPSRTWPIELKDTGRTWTPGEESRTWTPGKESRTFGVPVDKNKNL